MVANDRFFQCICDPACFEFHFITRVTDLKALTVVKVVVIIELSPIQKYAVHQGGTVYQKCIVIARLTHAIYVLQKQCRHGNRFLKSADGPSGPDVENVAKKETAWAVILRNFGFWKEHITYTFFQRENN